MTFIIYSVILVWGDIMEQKDIIKIINNFDIKNKYINHEQLFAGHINETYKIMLENDDNYILQKMNNYVFKNIPELMENIINII